MTVAVTFLDRYGRERTEEFENEYLALIFVDGLRARQRSDRDRDRERFRHIVSGEPEGPA